MDEKQQYFELWQTAVAKAAEALKAGNMEEAEKYHQDMVLVSNKYLLIHYKF